ncbi:MAG: glycosyltransferase [Candidatus Omnitrophica bacterium]|nr:glycosyltransferase [Candidatus Omnitrophota bacterium]
MTDQPLKILCFLSNDWDGLRGTEQKMMVRLMQRHPTLLVETVGFRFRRPIRSDLGRLWRRSLRWLRGPMRVGPQAWVLSPAALPYVGGALVQRLNNWCLRRQVLRAVRRLGFHGAVCWVYPPSPAVLALLAQLQPAVIVYECLDDYARFYDTTTETLEIQRALASRSQLVITISERLRQRLAPFNPQTHLIPNACDYDHFAVPADASHAAPRDLGKIPHPRIGYVGSFDFWVDLELIGSLAREHADWSFVLIGPITVLGLGTLAGLRNVRHLGRKPYDELPAYLQELDVVIFPYRAIEFMESADPLMLYDALASGKPVVSTDYAAVRRFEAVVRIARTPAGFGEAIAQALREDTPEQQARRRAAVRDLTWERRVAKSEELIVQRLTARRAGARGKLLHVITRAIPGGAADNVIATAEALRRQGWEVTLACAPDARNVPLAEARGIPVVTIPALCREVRPWRDLQAFTALYRLMRRERFALVHSHTAKAGVLAPVAARLAGVSRVVHSPRGSIYHDVYFSRPIQWSFAAVERWVAGLIDRLVVVCHSERREYVDRRIAPAAKYLLVRSGLDVRRFVEAAPVDVGSLRRALGLSADGPVIGHVARLTPEKGHRIGIQALAQVVQRYPTAQLLLVGDGATEDTLRRLVAEQGLTERVRFAGFRADIPAVLQAIDIFIQPSLWEGLPRAMVEAMLMAKPVVATSVGGIPEVITHEVSGLLISPNNPGALTAAILRLLDDPALSQRLAAAGRRLVEQEFEITRTTAQLSALYEELLAGQAAQQP